MTVNRLELGMRMIWCPHFPFGYYVTPEFPECPTCEADRAANPGVKYVVSSVDLENGVITLDSHADS